MLFIGSYSRKFHWAMCKFANCKRHYQRIRVSSPSSLEDSTFILRGPMIWELFFVLQSGFVGGSFMVSQLKWTRRLENCAKGWFSSGQHFNYDHIRKNIWYIYIYIHVRNDIEWSCWSMDWWTQNVCTFLSLTLNAWFVSPHETEPKWMADENETTLDPGPSTPATRTLGFFTLRHEHGAISTWVDSGTFYVSGLWWWLWKRAHIIEINWYQLDHHDTR